MMRVRSFSALNAALWTMGATGCTLIVNNELESKPAHVDHTGHRDAGNGDTSDGGSPDAAAMLADAAFGDASDTGSAPTTMGEVKLCVGEDHACALNKAGKLACWGKDDQGQTDLPTTGSYREIACGTAHTCALDTSGRLICSGRNADGQSPIVPVNGPFYAVAAGDAHTCALDDAGKAHCWGLDGDGQATPPADLFTSLTAGKGFTCGIRKSNASLFCWGQGASDFNTAADGKKLLSVAAGTDYVCFVTQEHQGFCAGDSLYQPAALSTVAQIAAGAYQACALLEDGSMRCWYSGTSDEAFAKKAPLEVIAVGGTGRCAVPAHGGVVCEPTDGSSALSPPPVNFP